MTLVRVIDFETTGFPPEAGVVEIGWTDVTIEGDHTDPEAAISVRISDWHNELVTTGRKIETAAMAVHHIQDADIIGCRSPEVVLDELSQDPDFFCAHNAKFEQEFFKTAQAWICTLKLAYRFCPKAPNHQNQTIRYFLNTPVDRHKCEPTHRAGPDSYVTAYTLAKFLETRVSFEKMAEWSALPPLMPTCPIGKFRGFAWADVDSGFLVWMIKQPSMESDLKWNAQRELNRRRDANKSS